MSRSSAAVATAFSEPEAQATAQVNSFQSAVALFGQHREAILQTQIMGFVHLVKFEQGHISVRLKEGYPQGLTNKMSDKLSQWTGQPWMISISREAGEPTLADVQQNQKQSVMEEIKAHPVVSEVLKIFPGAKIIDVRDRK
jgi:DNA polymerase-3 subunit gamma/tau